MAAAPDAPVAAPPHWPGAIGQITIAAAAIALVIAAVRMRWHRLRNAPRRVAAFTPVGGVGLFLGMVVLGQLGALLAGVFAARAGLAEESLIWQATIVFGAVLGQGIIVAGYVAAVRSARRPEPDRRRPIATAVIQAPLMMAAWWLIIQVTAMAGTFIAGTLSGVQPDVIAHETLRLMRDAPPDRGFYAMAALVILAVPVIEEVLYRGIVQQVMRQLGYGPWPAITVTSVVFALMHMTVVPPHAVPALFVTSLAFGWAYERTGRLAAPIVMHAVFNGGNLLMAGMV